MVLKLNLEKTYDKLEWGFIKETLRDADLPSKLIDAIMGIISKSKCKLLWNGEVTEFITPSRALRQGNALSPCSLSYAWRGSVSGCTKK